MNNLRKKIKKTTKQNKNYQQALDEIEYYINNQGINNKWNMRIQRFRMGILDHNPQNNEPSNLKALCQKCHNNYDIEHRKETRRKTKLLSEVE